MIKGVVQIYAQGENKGWTKGLDTGKKNCETLSSRVTPFSSDELTSQCL